MANTSQPGGSKGLTPGSPGSQPTGQTTATGAVQDAARKAQEMAADVGQRVGQSVTNVGAQMENLAGTIRQNVPRQGMMGTAAETVAEGLESGGRYLQEQDFGDMIDDLETIVRRYPIQAVLVGIGLGFILSRATRS